MDLSGEYHPIPKPAPKKKKKKTRIKAGKKTKAWQSVRERLKETFSKWGITECEITFQGCWKNTALGFAHIDKRQQLRADELTAVVLACTPCHEQVERMPRKQMREHLQKIITDREFRIAQDT